VTSRPGELQLAPKVAALLLALTAATAAAVHFLAAEQARQTLGFGFAGVPHTLGSAASIFANNARVLAAVLVACLAVQAGRGLADSACARALGQGLALICDGTLLVLCCLHVVVIGAAYGAYGLRTVRATVVHGPFELAAFSIGLALYLAARCERLSPARFALSAASAFALLAVGATLEAFA
jgi:hypothetical protein